MIKSARNNQRGFTLIELMVVIAIIAILATIGIVIFQGAQRQARDGKRQGDIEAIQKALESHYLSTQGGMCEGEAAARTAASYCPVKPSWFAGSKVPTDPLGGTNKYCLYYNDTNATAATAPSVWNPDGSCPAAGAGDTLATLDDGSTDPNPPGVGGVGTAFLHWQVCAHQESQSKVICEPSSQN